jgi:hypothetical protein
MPSLLTAEICSPGLTLTTCQHVERKQVVVAVTALPEVQRTPPVDVKAPGAHSET